MHKLRVGRCRINGHDDEGRCRRLQINRLRFKRCVETVDARLFEWHASSMWSCTYRFWLYYISAKRRLRICKVSLVLHIVGVGQTLHPISPLTTVRWFPKIGTIAKDRLCLKAENARIWLRTRRQHGLRRYFRGPERAQCCAGDCMNSVALISKTENVKFPTSRLETRPQKPDFRHGR